MSTPNRYTRLQNTTYQPRSLQELMMVPQYKRQQHDTLTSSIAQYETQLAQADSLDVHSHLQYTSDKCFLLYVSQDSGFLFTL